MTGGVGMRNGVVVSTVLRCTCDRAWRSWWIGIRASCAHSGSLGRIAASVHDLPPECFGDRPSTPRRD
jgi:hypothetical protein